MRRGHAWREGERAVADLDLVLAARAQPPDALRAVLAARPRGGWAHASPCGGPVRFWLARRLMSRGAPAGMQADTRAFVDGAAGARDPHGHHMIEDEHCVLDFMRRAPRLERGAAMSHAGAGAKMRATSLSFPRASFELADEALVARRRDVAQRRRLAPGRRASRSICAAERA
jgi:hypothetical protein